MGIQDNKGLIGSIKDKDPDELKKHVLKHVINKVAIAAEQLGIISAFILISFGVSIGFGTAYLHFQKSLESAKSDNASNNAALSERDNRITQVQSQSDALDAKNKRLESDIEKYKITTDDILNKNKMLLAEIDNLKKLTPDDILFNQLYSFNSTGIKANTSYFLSSRFKISVDGQCSISIFDVKLPKPTIIKVNDYGSYHIRLGDLKIYMGFRFMGGDEFQEKSLHSMDICFFTFLREQN